MEKLQQALEKARADRGAIQPKATAAKTVTFSDSVWADLKEAKVDPALLNKNRILAHGNSRDATPFDILRTKIVVQMRKHGWKRLAITSASPTCGKSTIAGNLIFGLSRQVDTRAILFEIDLRNPSLKDILGITPPRNVAAVLTGEVPFAEQAMRIGGNAALSLATKRVANSTEVLFDQRAQAVISDIETAYQPDLVLFDTAPILVGDDTRAFLSQVDCALIVACAERTTISQIDVCEREIAEQTNVLGVVLNQTRFIEQDTSYGYGYGAASE